MRAKSQGARTRAIKDEVVIAKVLNLVSEPVHVVNQIPRSAARMRVTENWGSQLLLHAVDETTVGPILEFLVHLG
jgi:hypothetical protein